LKKHILTILTVSVLFAQSTDFETQYYYDAIYLQQGFFGQKYVKGGESFHLRSIRKEMDQYQESSDLYEKSFIMRMLGLGALIIGPVASSALVEKDPSSFLTIYLGSAFLGTFAAFESYNKLNEAIWVYNREQLKRRNDDNEFESESNSWRWKESTP